MAHINGTNLRWLIDGSAVFAATNGSIQITRDLRTTTIEHKDDSGSAAGWNTSTPGAKSFSGTCEAFLTDEGTTPDIETMFDALDNGTELDFDFVDAVESNIGFEGKVLITSIDVNAPDKEESTYTLSFTGTGPLTKYVST